MFLSIVLVAMIALVGCGNKDKKLTCSVTSENAKFLMLGDSQEAVVTFKEDKVSKVSMEMVIKADSKEQAEEYKSQYEQLLSSDTSTDVKAETKVDGTNFIVTEKIEDVSKLSEETKKELLGEDITYDGLKKYYEEQGYTCK